jgi:hypothetical protein
MIKAKGFHAAYFEGSGGRRDKFIVITGFIPVIHVLTTSL